MECIHCKSEMTPANLFTFGGIEIESKTKSVLETPERSAVECYVCSKCGYIELKAKDHKKF